MSRRRRVRLTAEAFDLFQRELVKKWEEQDSSGKLTIAARAKLMDLSPATAERVWANKGGDRATLALVFKNVGIPWQDAYCEFVAEPAAVPSVGPPNAAPPRSRPLSSWRNAIGLAVAVGAVALLVRPTTGRAKPAGTTPGRVPEFYRLMVAGYNGFERGNYSVAEGQLRGAVDLGRKHLSAIELAVTVRLLADVHAAQGSFDLAISEYNESLTVTNTFHQDERKPALYEALGDAETRVGYYAKARTSLLLSLSGYRRFRVWEGVAMADRDLGSLSFRLGHLGEANAWFRESLRYLQKVDKPDIVTDVRARWALVACAEGKREYARTELKKCLAYWEHQRHPRWVATTKTQLASVELAEGDSASAASQLSEAKALFRSVGDKAGVAEAGKLLDRAVAAQDHRFPADANRLVRA